MVDVRVRVAPSPTGAPHLGTAYIALFNRLFARRHGGRLILRIEDTDRSRSHRDHERRLIDALRWLGIDWDEGPVVGGASGPYRQSERLDRYQEAAEVLVESGHAYHSFVTPAELAAWRAEGQKAGEPPPHEAERDADPGDGRRRRAAGESCVIRMKVPREGDCAVPDLLRGEIRFDLAGLDDQVLLKSDGFPTYHLAVVVDDHLMGISHVIRGEEWINSTPKHLLLYEWLGWEPPVHAHLPLLLNPDRSKMSKRRNPTSIDYYRRAGYLPAAVLNYLALMAYPPARGADGSDEEKFGLDELAARFELERINLGGSVFDLEKLSWLNGRYIREDLTEGELLEALRDWALNDDSFGSLVPLMQPRMETLGDFLPKCAFLFARRVEPRPEDLVPKKRTPSEVTEALQCVVWALEEMTPWGREGVEAALQMVASAREWPIRDLTRPLYAALMGQPVGPPLYESMVLLGADLTRARILEAIEVLGGLSKKKARRLEKEWTGARERVSRPAS